jgi:hypothetical protein
MLHYLENFKDLYKTLWLVPSHHIALHLGEFLCSFGPVHAWRAFTFERYNYLLQHENTNRKFGKQLPVSDLYFKLKHQMLQAKSNLLWWITLAE